MSGYIRFVGGPKHNEHLRIPNWVPTYRFPHPEVFRVYRAGSYVPLKPCDQFYCYELRSMATEGGTQFFEYHLVG